MQFVMNERNQARERLFIPAPALQKERGHCGWVVGNPAILRLFRAIQGFADVSRFSVRDQSVAAALRSFFRG
jgi:hypothetical protein